MLTQFTCLFSLIRLEPKRNCKRILPNADFGYLSRVQEHSKGDN